MTDTIFQRTMALTVTITIALAMAVGTSVAASAANGPYPIKLLEPASGIFSPAGMAIDPLTGDLVTANPVSGTVGILPKQSGTIFGQAVTANVDVPLYTATGLDQPAGVAFDAAGDLFISNPGYSDSITVIARTSTTIFGQAFSANVPTVLTAAQGIITPMGIAFDAAGNLFVAAENGTGDIYVIPKNSGTIFGQSVTANENFILYAASGPLGNPFGVAFDPAGNLFISYQGSIRIVPAASGTLYGRTTTANTKFDLTGLGNQIQGIAVDANDNIFYADQGNPSVGVYSPTAGTIFGVSVTANTPTPILTSQDPIGYPQAVLLDGSGNLYTSSFFSLGTSLGSILFLSPSATTLFGQQIPANTGTPFLSPAPLNFPAGMARDSHGNVYVASILGGQILVDPAATGTLFGQSVTAGVVTVLAAAQGLNTPQGLAVDAAGNLYITTQAASEVSVLAPSATTLFGQQIPANTVTSLSATSGSANPVAIAFDTAGNLYIGDSVVGGPNVAVVAPSATTLFGQQVPANTFTELSASSTLTTVTSLALDSSGRLYVGCLNGTISVLSPTPGTVLGTPVVPNTATQIDDGLSSLSTTEISGLSVDAAGDLFVSGLSHGSGDAILTLVGVIAPTASTILGQAVSANTLTALSSAANISLPLGILVVPDGSLYLASATGFWEIANLATPPIPVVPATLAATGAPLGTFALVAATFVGAGFVGLDQRRRRRTSQSSLACATASS